MRGHGPSSESGDRYGTQARSHVPAKRGTRSATAVCLRTGDIVSADSAG